MSKDQFALEKVGMSKGSVGELHRRVFQTGVSRQRVISNHGTFSSPSAQKVPV
jgi:hypothetical protein